jgi:hypothetical protein
MVTIAKQEVIIQALARPFISRFASERYTNISLCPWIELTNPYAKFENIFSTIPTINVFLLPHLPKYFPIILDAIVLETEKAAKIIPPM